MRELSSDFANHIASKETTLANCWRIVRLDGIVLGFTDHDEELIFEGHSFKPAHGANIGEVASKLGAQTDSSEIIGIVSSDAISEDDILLGRYDGAMVETYKVNWRDVNIRHLLRTDYIGEITRTDGAFSAELRSAQYQMNIVKGKIYQSFCGARLGDTQCKIDKNNSLYKTTSTVVSLVNSSTIAINLLSEFAENWFSYGTVFWTSGKRNGKTDIITTHKNDGALSIISFSEPIIDWVETGDEFTLFVGCDRHFTTCIDKFENVINFQGFPHIPGSDFILTYPKSGNRFSGEPLFK